MTTPENKLVRKRPLGLLKGKVDFVITEYFKMTDDELLGNASRFINENKATKIGFLKYKNPR